MEKGRVREDVIEWLLIAAIILSAPASVGRRETLVRNDARASVHLVQDSTRVVKVGSVEARDSAARLARR